MFMASLAAYMRSRSVTTYMTVDVPTIVGPELSFSGTPLLVFAENLLLLRYAEYEGELHRVFAVLKMRFSDYDRALRVYTIRAGVGKTRLAQEVSVRANERGFFVLVGRCYEERASLPLYPFAEALSAALRTAPDQLGLQTAARWPELDALLSTTPSRTAAVARLGSSVEAQRNCFRASPGTCESSRCKSQSRCFSTTSTGRTAQALNQRAQPRHPRQLCRSCGRRQRCRLVSDPQPGHTRRQPGQRRAVGRHGAVRRYRAELASQGWQHVKVSRPRPLAVSQTRLTDERSPSRRPGMALA